MGFRELYKPLLTTSLERRIHRKREIAITWFLVMAVHTLLLSGPIEKPLQFPVLRLHCVNEGEWELAIASVSLVYNKRIPRSLAAISCNYVLTSNINKNKDIISSNQILGITTIGKSIGEKHTIISFKRDYFVINRADPTLFFYFKNLEKEEEPFAGATVYLYLYLRRKR